MWGWRGKLVEGVTLDQIVQPAQGRGANMAKEADGGIHCQITVPVEQKNLEILSPDTVGIGVF